MARILIAWEVGAGLGRLAQIAPVARGLAARGHRLAVSVPTWMAARPGALARATALLGCETVAAPRAAPPAAIDSASPRSYADVMFCGHFDRPLHLVLQAQAWQRLFASVRPDLVLVHHAPSALFAAHAAGLPCAQFGDGYVVPPAESPLRPTTPWAPASAEAMRAAERAVSDTIAGACRTLAVRDPGTVAGLLRTAREYLCTWPFLDHYGARAQAYYYGIAPDPIVGGHVDWPAGPGPRVFGYLSDGHPLFAPLTRALAALGWPSILVCGEAPEAPACATLRHRTEPVDARVLEHCDLVVSHSPLLTSARALRQGRPMLALPVNAEQRMVCAQLIGLGTAQWVDAADLAATGADPQAALAGALAGLLADRRFAERARAIAAALRGVDEGAAQFELIDDLCTDFELRPG
jgi:hypothetical protein